MTEGDTWQEAFLKVLPERKNARPIVPEQCEEQEESKSLDARNTLLVDTEVPDKVTDQLICKIETNVAE